MCTNILGLVELLFTLPMSNGWVERIFSVLKLIKTDRHTKLSEDHLDDLLRISVDGPPASEWDATNAVRLWWSSKQRRQVGDTQTASTPRQVEASTSSDSQFDSAYLNLEDWDCTNCIYHFYTILKHYVMINSHRMLYC